MGFVQRELDRLGHALQALTADGQGEGPRWQETFAAQQALSWSTEPTGFASPLDAIERRYAENEMKLDAEAAFAETGGLSIPPRG